MSRWAHVKHTLELDWRMEWHQIATQLPGAPPAEVVALVLRMDDAWWAKDKAQFLALKDQLVKSPSWTGSSDSSSGSRDAGSAKPTAVPTVLALPI